MDAHKSGRKFLHFYAVFGENWSNIRSVPLSPSRLAFSSMKSRIRHWEVNIKIFVRDCFTPVHVQFVECSRKFSVGIHAL